MNCVNPRPSYPANTASVPLKHYIHYLPPKDLEELSLVCEEELELFEQSSASRLEQEETKASDEYQPLEIEEYEDWQLGSEYVTSLLGQEATSPLQTGRHVHITRRMRATLIDWMMEVCSEFTLKRETFHLAVHFVDRALAALAAIETAHFQLLGLAAMVLAAKLEEVTTPSLKDWARTADNGFSLAQVQEMEKVLLQALDWKLCAVTRYNWLNWLMTAWDNFLAFHYSCVPCNRPEDFASLPESEFKLQKKQFERRFIAFKLPNHQAYKRFREAMQVLDLASMDDRCAAASPRLLACSLLYLLICKFFSQTQYALLYYEGPGSVRAEEADMYENAIILQDLFAGFLREAVGVYDIREIYESLVLLHPFLDCQHTLELPTICSVESKHNIERHYDEFLAYQTYGPHYLEFIKPLL